MQACKMHIIRDTKLEVTIVQYLGSIFSADNNVNTEVSNRSAKADM